MKFLLIVKIIVLDASKLNLMDFPEEDLTSHIRLKNGGITNMLNFNPSKNRPQKLSFEYPKPS
jgi:hypothetical protein